MDVQSFLKSNSSFFLLVKTNKNDTKITAISDNQILMDVKEKPIDGKANEAIIKFFKKKYKVRIKIKSGLFSSKKLIEILKV